jgi:hypothetical protein
MSKKKQKTVPKSQEIATFKVFIKENETLITAIGVMGALAAFFSTMPNGFGIYPALIAFAMLLVLCAELTKSLFAIRRCEETLSLFKMLSILFPSAVFLFIVESFWNQITFRTWFLPFVLMEGIYLVIPRKKIQCKKISNNLCSGYNNFFNIMVFY